MADWFRWWHGTVTDPKFMWVSRRSGCSLADVLAVWAALLETASNGETRGNVSCFDSVSHDCLFGFEDGVCDQIITAMSEKGIVDSDGNMTGWERRQPKREDQASAESRAKSSTERVRAYRDRMNAKRSETDETETKRSETQETDRGEERRGELTTSSLRSEVVGDSDDAQRTTSGTPKRAHALSKDFEPDDTAIALAAELQISLAVELPKFRDYHAARGKPMKDWQAALRTWLRNAREFAGPISSPLRPVSRDEGRAIAASTRLADYRAASAADRGEDDDRTIEAPSAPRLLG